MIDLGTFLLIVALVSWEFVCKGIALWRAAKNNQKSWFIGLLITNSLGIIPLIYLRFFQRQRRRP